MMMILAFFSFGRTAFQRESVAWGIPDIPRPGKA
jgi:hypothetical protein